jgi:hypothetical protein
MNLNYLLPELVLETIGLFRITGATPKVNALKEEVDSGKPIDFASVSQPHIVCTVLKQWLRMLPEPLIIFSLFDQFLNVASSCRLVCFLRIFLFLIIIDNEQRKSLLRSKSINSKALSKHFQATTSSCSILSARFAVKLPRVLT